MSDLNVYNKELREYNEQLAISIQQTNEWIKANKSYVTAMSKGADVLKKKNDALKNEKKAVSELQKLSKQRETSIKKILALESQTAKAVAKNRLEIQKKNKYLKQEAQLSNVAKDSLTAQRIALSRLTEQYNSASKTIQSKLAPQIRKLNDDISKQEQAIGNSRRNVGNYGSALSGLPGVLGRVGFAMTTVGTIAKTVFANPIFLAIGAVAGLVKVVSSSIKSAKEFQSANADLAATLGVTRQETDALQESQKELGKTTAFSAVEVAQLQNEYAKLGFAQQEIIDLSKATIDLSVATRSSADEAANYIGSIVNIYDLSASEAVRVADVTAKAAASSALDFGKLSEALPIVGTTAKVAGDNLEQTAAKLGILADRGIKAETAATALRNIYLELAKQGITYDEALDKINNSSNKNATSMELFGKRGATVATVLAQNITQVNELEKVLNAAGGTAEKVANEKLDTLAGATTLLKSAWEGLKLTITDGEGVIIGAVQGIVEYTTRAVNALSFILSGIQGVFKGLGGTLKIIKAEVANIFIELLSSIPLIGDKIAERLAPAKQAVADLRAETGSFADVWKNAFDNALPKIDEANASIKTTTEVVEELTEAFVTLGSKMSEGFDAKKFADDFKKSADDIIAKNAEVTDDQLESAAEIRKEREDYYSTIEGLQDELNNQLIESGKKIIVDQIGANIDENLAKFESSQQAKKDILKQRLDDGVISESEYQKQIADIDLKSRQESAKAEKKKAIFNTTIDTAAAVVKTFANLGYPAGIVPAALVASIGLAKGIAIAAQPIPQFKDGVMNFGGGMAIVGDGGESEVIHNPDGSMYLTPSTSTATYLEKGANVYNVEQQKKVFGQKVSNEQELMYLRKIANKPDNAMTAKQYGSVKKSISVRDNIDRQLRGK